MLRLPGTYRSDVWLIRNAPGEVFPANSQVGVFFSAPQSVFNISGANRNIRVIYSDPLPFMNYDEY